MDTSNKLAPDLPEIKRHNTTDRSMGIGRPPANDDGTRTYRLGVVDHERDPVGPATCPACGMDDPGFIDVETPDCPVTCEGCEHETVLREWTRSQNETEIIVVDIDPPEEHCPQCGCPDSSDGQCIVGDHQITCPCGCHGTQAENDDHSSRARQTQTTYRGGRRIQTRYAANDLRKYDRSYTTINRDGERLPCREDVRRIGQMRDWGPASTSMARRRLALDLAMDVLGDEDRALRVYELLAEALIKRIPGDKWTITDVELRHGIEAIESAKPEEVRR